MPDNPMTRYGHKMSINHGVESVTITSADGKQLIRPANALQFAERALTLDGTASGTSEMAGVFSPGSPGIFFIQPASSENMYIYRFSLVIEDTVIGMNRFGGISGGLTNGVRIISRINTTETLDILNGRTLQTNVDIAHLSPIGFKVEEVGSGEDAVLLELDLGQTGGPNELIGAEFENIAVIIQDDLSALVNMEITASGYIINNI